MHNEKYAFLLAHLLGINLKEFFSVVDSVEEPESLSKAQYFPSSGGTQYSIQKTLDIIIEVIANFKACKVPIRGIEYLAVHVDKFSSDLGGLHPEFLSILFEKLDTVYLESVEIGIRLIWLLHVERWVYG